jgi:hypothetical protein
MESREYWNKRMRISPAMPLSKMKRAVSSRGMLNKRNSCRRKTPARDKQASRKMFRIGFRTRFCLYAFPSVTWDLNKENLAFRYQPVSRKTKETVQVRKICLMERKLAFWLLLIRVKTGNTAEKISPALQW